jgi:hypothetical protein
VISAWRRYRALPPADRRLLSEALALLALVRPGLVILPFSLVRRLLHSYATQDGDLHAVHAASARDGEANVPARVAWAIAALSRRAPGPTTCLAQALVADALLRRRGVRSALRIGVRKPATDAPGPLQAHAWVECGDQIVVGRLDDLSEYSVLSAPESP